MKLKSIIITTSLLVFSMLSFAQEMDRRAANSIYGGLVGNGLVLSIDYHRILVESDQFFIDANIGIGTHLLGMNLPHGINFNYGKKHHLEIGFGGTYITSEWMGSTTNNYVYYPLLGYRLQEPKGGFSLRVYANPIFYYGTENDDSGVAKPSTLKIAPWGGVGLGVAF